MDNQLLDDLRSYFSVHPSSPLDLNNLSRINKHLWNTFLSKPHNIIPLITNILPSHDLTVRGYLGYNDITPRHLSSTFLNQFVSVSGIIISVSLCKPDLCTSVHYSSDLNTFYSKSYNAPQFSTNIHSSENKSTEIFSGPVSYLFGKSNYPHIPREYMSTPLTFEMGLSTYTDVQKVVIQELVETSPPGQIPRTVECILVGHNFVGKTKPGDRVKIYGVYKCMVGDSLPGVFPTRFKGIIVCFSIEPLSFDEVASSEGKFKSSDFLNLLECYKKWSYIFDKYLEIHRNEGSIENLNSNVLNEIKNRDINSNYNIELKVNDNRQINFIENGCFKSKKQIDIMNFHRALQISSSTKNTPLSYLSNFIAPSIFGHSTIKKAVVLLLLSGTPHTKENESSIRSTMNILLIGEPSTAKSQILRYLTNLFNFLSASGRGSSGVGLTALVMRDSETGEKYVQAGAMVLSDMSVLCIDEFDKIGYDDRVALHEAMEQQSVSISKAGLNVILNARCSVLAAANPRHANMNINLKNKSGKFPGKRFQNEMGGNVIDVVDMEESLLTRFDLVFCIEDKVNDENDRKIAEKVMENHSEHKESIMKNIGKNKKEINNKNTNSLGTDLKDFLITNEKNIQIFKQFIIHAKQLNPQLSIEAREMIIKKYTDLRQKRKKSMLNIKITPRTLETIIRMSCAHAKTRLSEIVMTKDVEESINIILYSMEMKNNTVEEPDLNNTIDIVADNNIDDVILNVPFMDEDEDETTLVTDLLFTLKENNDERFVLLDDICKMCNVKKNIIEKILWSLNENDVIIFDGKMITFI